MPAELISCLMCLQADEAPNMLHVEVEDAQGAVAREIVLCRRCVGAILAAAQGLVASESQQEPEGND